ncbi:MAG: hypothetical protein HY319_31755 [Armatimonadetes bacterium]|nr:hypothetical protein [Armatimonadota bacterium]
METIDGFLQQVRDAGDLDSRGRFSYDLERAVPLLARFQLPDPSHYVLRLVAAAFAGGASRLEIDQKGTNLEFRFDGAGFDFADFRDLFPCLVAGGDPRLADFGSALNSLRVLADQVVCHGRGARLTLDSARMCIEPMPEADDRTRLVVRWGPLRSWRGRASPSLSSLRQVLRERCFSEPLELLLQGRALAPPEIVASARMIVGDPPPLSFVGRLVHEVRTPGVVGACGYLSFGESDRQDGRLVQQGVLFPLELQELYPGLQGWFWYPDLPLDLARNRPVAGPALDRLLAAVETFSDEFALQVALVEPERFRLQLDRWLDRRGSDPEYRAMLQDAGLFRTAEGKPISLRNLQETLSRKGYISMGSRECDILAPTGKLRDLLQQSVENVLMFELPSGRPRLPDHEEYLARLPSTAFPGEVALLAEPPHARYKRYYCEGAQVLGFSHEPTSHLAGLAVAAPAAVEHPEPGPETVELYLALLHRRLDERQSELRSHHYLEFLATLVRREVRLGARAPLTQLLESESFSRARLGGSLTRSQVKRMIMAVELERADRKRIPLISLLAPGPWSCHTVYSDSPPPDHLPAETLLLLPGQADRLERLLGRPPETLPPPVGRVAEPEPVRLTPFPSRQPTKTGELRFTRALESVISRASNWRQARTTSLLLRALLHEPSSSGARILKELCPGLPSPRQDPPEPVRSVGRALFWAERRASELGALCLATEHLLLGLMESGGAAQGYLAEHGLPEFSSVRDLAATRYLHLEALEDGDGPTRVRVHRACAREHLLRQDWVAAAAELRQAVELDRADALSLAAVLARLGDMQGSAALYAGYLECHPGDLDRRARLAEVLLWQGLREPARQHCRQVFCLDEQHPQARVQMARLALLDGDAALALQLCGGAPAEPPVGYHELRAEALDALGRAAEAQEEYRKFLRMACPELAEPVLDRRRQKARERLGDAGDGCPES